MNYTTIGNAKKQTGLSYLGGISISQKFLKSKKYSGTYTYAFYLAPSNQSGYNVCPNATPECKLGCLATSGRAAMELSANKSTIANARIKKTRLFHENKDFFMGWLIDEIKHYQLKAQKDGYEFSARLNATADIDWANVKYNGQNIFQIFPDVQFYDYTKNPVKMVFDIPNYHITFSYSGRNSEIAMDMLNKGKNIAVVFDTKKNKPLPSHFKGFRVVDGDLTDARFLDEKGVVVGLRWKRIANKAVEAEILNSVFVVKETELAN